MRPGAAAGHDTPYGRKVVCSDNLGEVDEHLLVVQSRALVVALQSEQHLAVDEVESKHLGANDVVGEDADEIGLVVVAVNLIYWSNPPPLYTHDATASTRIRWEGARKRVQTSGADGDGMCHIFFMISIDI